SALRRRGSTGPALRSGRGRFHIRTRRSAWRNAPFCSNSSSPLAAIAPPTAACDHTVGHRMMLRRTLLPLLLLFAVAGSAQEAPRKKRILFLGGSDAFAHDSVSDAMYTMA